MCVKKKKKLKRVSIICNKNVKYICTYQKNKINIHQKILECAPKH